MTLRVAAPAVMVVVIVLAVMPAAPAGVVSAIGGGGAQSPLCGAADPGGADATAALPDFAGCAGDADSVMPDSLDPEVLMAAGQLLSPSGDDEWPAAAWPQLGRHVLDSEFSAYPWAWGTVHSTEQGPDDAPRRGYGAGEWLRALLSATLMVAGGAGALLVVLRRPRQRRSSAASRRR